MSFNLSVIVRESARSHPQHPAIIHADGVLAYAELDDRSDRVASGLARLGIQPGDAVAVQLPNVVEFVEVLYGVLKAGAVLVPLNVLNKGPEIAYVLEHAHVKALVTHAGTAREAARGAEEAGLEHLFVVGGGEHLPAGTQAYTDLSNAKVRTPAPYVQRDPGDTAVLLYTSGTTGKPKGVKLTHFQLFMNAREHTEAFAMDNDSVTIAVMPLFHALGLSGLLNATVFAGGTVVLLPKFDPTKVLEAIQEHHATILHGVPTMYHAMLHHPERTTYDTSSLRHCGSAGAAIAAELLDKFEVEFGVASWRCTASPRAVRWRPTTGPTTASRTASARRSGAPRSRSGTTRTTSCPRARSTPASWSSADTTPWVATWTTTRPRPRRSPEVGCTAEIWAIGTRTASCSSSTGRRR